MGLFNLDIEKFYEVLEERNQQLKGIFCIQYPIYCIHSNITDSTPDALDALDKLIIDLYIAKSDYSTFQVGSLIGTSKSLVELRINKLIIDKLLKKKGSQIILTDKGNTVFNEKTQIRQHKKSYDFYMDGITLQPLPKVFYINYRNKLISENDSYYYTNSKGEPKLKYPFGPDLVHTPPNEDKIINNIFLIENTERGAFNIPERLISIDDISFTKMTLQLLIAVSSKGEKIEKDIVDSFAIYSMEEDYYETVQKNVKLFAPNLKGRIENMVFKITIPSLKEDRQEQPKPFLTTNWPEIDKYRDFENKCFSFSSEDLIKVAEQIFQIKPVLQESVINEDSIIEITIDKHMLLDSPNRSKLINDLIRERDYKFGNVDNNVFLMYLYYKTVDDFVKKVIDFKKILNKHNNCAEINLAWLDKNCREFNPNYRELLVSAGEYILLENLDIEKYMIQFN